LHYVYTGNVHDKQGGSTYCHGCGERVIERDWYELGMWKVTDTGCCAKCGAEIPGVFRQMSGQWGRRRQPVWLASR